MEENIFVTVIETAREQGEPGQPDQLALTVEIARGASLEEAEVLTVRKHGYPLETTPDEIREDLERIKDATARDLAHAERLARDEAERQATSGTLYKINGLSV